MNKGKETDKELNNGASCATTYEDDDNLSIYSGVISITDSESEVEEGPDDFVDIPFPACFDVVEHKGGLYCLYLDTFVISDVYCLLRLFTLQ